jgi:predicted ArsR family transcriptional regulator
MEAAAAILGELGGLAEVEGCGDDALVLRGYSCPLAGLVPDHPEVCTLAESLVGALVGAPVRECCDQGDPPRCRFEVTRVPEARPDQSGL